MSIVFSFVSGDTIEAKSQGEKRYFTITGYYSPLPDQNFYITGDYESEKRLNGQGIRGADGTPVYPGMIAAPKSYPFGTKICIPNFGCGTVHDRGGAIVEQGERKLAKYDRLDLWMGYGEEGLLRALAWGVPSVECELFGIDAEVKDSVSFQVPMPLNQIIDLPEKITFGKNLSLGAKGETVKELQRSLAKLGFHEGLIDGVFDEELKASVLTFQKKKFVVNASDEFGAGSFGPKTRKALSEALHHFETQERIRKTWEEFHFEDKVKYGARSRAAYKLQEVLIQEEFLDHAPTGYFGQITKEALIEFQQTHGIIASENDTEAGKVGADTTTLLNTILTAKREEAQKEKQAIFAYTQSYGKLAYLAGKGRNQGSVLAQK